MDVYSQLNVEHFYEHVHISQILGDKFPMLMFISIPTCVPELYIEHGNQVEHTGHQSPLHRHCSSARQPKSNIYAHREQNDWKF